MNKNKDLVERRAKAVKEVNKAHGELSKLMAQPRKDLATVREEIAKLRSDAFNLGKKINAIENNKSIITEQIAKKWNVKAKTLERIISGV